MIARLVGELVEKDGGNLIVDVNGVGYEVFVSLSASASMGPTGSKVTLIVYTDVRETAIVLYGFRTNSEKQTFLLLKKVKGIGSKIAMVILSTMKPEDLMIAIGRSDATALTRIPGIGKKSAERIIVELREKVVEFVKDADLSQSSTEIRSISSDQQVFSVLDDAALALQKLGFSKDVANKAVREAQRINPKLGEDVGEVVRLSLSCLG